MFERDKEELRSLGIPIEVGYVDRSFEDEPGYRIERSAFELPDIDLTPEEAAVIGLAARVWQHAGLAAATSDALVKLKAAGVTVDRAMLDVVQPQLTAEEPAFEPLWDATRTHTPVRFGYRTSAGTSTATRHLQPWGVVSYRGRWYVVGHDTDRSGPRVFRLSRVQGAVRTDGPAGSYEVPAGTDLRAVTASLAPAPADRTAEVLVRRESATACAGTPHRPPSRPTSRRAGTGSPRRTARPTRSPTRSSGTAPTWSCSPAGGPPRHRRPPAARGRGRGGGGRVSGARDQVGRLLALVPYLQSRREVSLEQAARDFGVRPAQIVKDLNVLWFCGLPGLGMGDLIDVDMEALEGERRHPGVQRRLPEPPAAAGQLGGVRPDRRAAGAAGGQRRRRPPDRGPHAGQAGGRRRGRRGPRGAGAHPAPRAAAAGRHAPRPALAARWPSAGRCGWTTTSRPATSPPSASSTRCGW